MAWTLYVDKYLHDDPVSAGLAELAEKTNSVIKDLRTYVGELQDRSSSDYVNALVSSVQRHARKFGELYDIEVEVKTPSEMNINDRLAAEVFQIVQEGLSNIKRHTASSTATISMMSRNGDMILDIENESSARRAARPSLLAQSQIALSPWVDESRLQ